MSYSSNQFYNYKEYEKGPSGTAIPLGRQPVDNPEFYYPGKSPNIYDVPGKRSTVGPIQRGFIRGIFPSVVKSVVTDNKNTKGKKDKQGVYTSLDSADIPTRRCFFQFNPSLILRSVQASTTTLNPLLQDPSQLLQPIPGQASFEFQLLFNREPEVAAQEYLDANREPQKTKPISESLAAYGADPRVGKGGLPYAQSQVGDLGVLVDLYVLDSIIGQSITQDSIKAITAYWESTKTARASDELDKDGKPIQPYADVDFLNDKQYSESLEKVLGNSAFLNPMPVRIVFSSLFMVEGFVTASNVAFHKFSRNMVPTVCQVTLSVQALYIGFAKKDAFLTRQLEEGIKNTAADTQETADNINTCLALLNKQVQVDFEKMYYSEDYLKINGAQADESLNDWFYKVYTSQGADFNKNGKTGLDFGEALGKSGSDSISMWTSEIFKERNLTDARGLAIENINIFFYDVDRLPSNVNTEAKLVERVEKGQMISGNGPNFNYQAASKILWTNFRSGIFSSSERKPLKEAGGGGTPNKFELASRGKKYKIDWYGEDLRIKGLDYQSLKNPQKYFGDKVIVLVVVTLMAGSKSASGEDKINRVYKAAATTLNPNTEGISKVPHLRFGAR